MRTTLRSSCLRPGTSRSTHSSSESSTCASNVTNVFAMTSSQVAPRSVVSCRATMRSCFDAASSSRWMFSFFGILYAM